MTNHQNGAYLLEDTSFSSDEGDGVLMCDCDSYSSR